MDLFETMRLENGEIKRETYHERRLTQSCDTLNFPFKPSQWRKELSAVKKRYHQGVYRVKTIVTSTGAIQIEIAHLPHRSYFTSKFQPLPKSIPSFLLTNKTTERAHLSHDHSTDVVLLYAKCGKVLEFDIGNLIVEENNHWYTPSIAEDMLSGCMRQALLDQGKVKVKDYQVEELKEKIKEKSVNIYLMNSLREVVEVKFHL
ncbi:aminotransferase class IV [Staphylococcus sp. SQ8-PEA]|uniref:Aminotransferase class IV n=1 Tax=Staphylococcus marylandisciuri TaxID=2981529 RepID=A0ABT2QPB6_9STAP|nr:aminotransferase class IV [Staphylococcus marylandisciuri]MCU5745802.1 aminotransferase class IV [Staphylococcus marylandisciuri]